MKKLMKSFITLLLSCVMFYCLISCDLSSDDSDDSDEKDDNVVNSVPIPVNGTLLLEENFDSYAKETYIGNCGYWKTLYNASLESGGENWIITDRESVSGPNSLQVYGSHSGCWGGDAYVPISGEHLLLSANIRAGGEAGGGCHSRDISITFGNKDAEEWGVGIAGVAIRTTGSLNNDPEGMVCGAYGSSETFHVIESYEESIHKWIEVAIEIDYSKGKAKFWIDNSYQGALEFNTVYPVNQVSVSSGDGIGWIDDLKVYDLDENNTATIGEEDLQTYDGATLHSEIATGSQNGGYNLAYYGTCLYTVDWEKNEIMKVSTLTDRADTAYPRQLGGSTGIHGISFNSETGNLFACDLDGETIIKYDSDLNILNQSSVGAQPVGCYVYNNKLYVVDRAHDEIYVLDTTTLDIISEYSISETQKNNYADYIDIYIINDKMYLAGEDISGYIIMDLDGTNQVNTVLDNRFYRGIYVTDTNIYLNSGNEIVVLDKDNNITNKWLLEYQDVCYTDVFVDESYLYTTSYSNGEGSRSPHILKYEIN